MDREEFKEKAKKGIDDLFAKIEELDQKKDMVQDQVKAKYNEKIAELKIKKAELQLKYQSLKESSGDKWDDAKGSFNTSFESLKEGFSKLTEILKNR
jgi:hypothetical protein